MKKVFNASILAASLGLAFAANAATISSDPAQLSIEGLSLDLFSTADIVFDTVVTKEHASSAEIVLTLSENVDLATNTVTGGACTNNVGAGTGVCGDISFDYGTGSFTFDSVEVDDEANTITFNVNLGNPLTANSAFRTTIGGTPILMGAATVAYASNLAGTAIETGTGVIATEVQQFSATVSTDFDGVIERVDRDEFVPASQTDAGALTFVDKTADVVNPVAVSDADGVDVVLMGDFSDAVTHVAAAWAAGGAAAAAVVNNAAGTITFNYTEAEWNALIGGTGISTLTFTKQGAADIIEVTDFTVDTTVNYDDTAGVGGTADSVQILDDEGAGSWELDAAVVNVPYLPAGYGYTAQVELSNHGSTDAEVIVEGFDNFGNEYAAVVLGTAEAHTVTRFTEGQLKAAFGIPAADQVKLNVTFIVDADADKVTLVPYYRQNESRINVITDQYKADSIR